MNKKLFGALCLAIACAGAALFSNGYLVSLLLRTIHCS